MTFVKFNGRGQSVLEYFILSIIMVSLFLVFSKHGAYTGLKTSLNTSLANATATILNNTSATVP
jgi:hypothetical protein